MDTLGALRDKNRNTRLAILAHLHERPGTTLSDVAGRLDVTVQAVSAHVKRMVADGLVSWGDAGAAVTPAGLQELHESVRGLMGAVGDLTRRLRVIRTTSAVATEAIRPGDVVRLDMVDGELAARPGPGPSHGTAQGRAVPGDEVVVGDLQGLVDLEPGRIRIISVPGPDEGGAAGVRKRDLAKATSGAAPARVGALGTGATVLARRHGPVHFEFAAAEASFNAAERGLEVRLWVSRDRLAEALETLERCNQATLRRVPVDVVEVQAARQATRGP